MAASDRLLTYREVERLLRVTPRTRRRIFRAHGVRVVSVTSKTKLVPATEIERLLDGQCRPDGELCGAAQPEWLRQDEARRRVLMLLEVTEDRLRGTDDADPLESLGAALELVRQQGKAKP